MRRIGFVAMLVAGGALPLVAVLSCSGGAGNGTEQAAVETASARQVGPRQIDVTVRPGALKKDGQEQAIKVAGERFWGRGPFSSRVTLRDSVPGGRQFLPVNDVEAGMVVSSPRWGDLKRILVDRPIVHDTTWADEILVIGLYTKIPPTDAAAGAASDQKRLDAAGINLPAMLRSDSDMSGEAAAMAESYYCIKCEGGIRVCGVEPVCR